MNAANPLVETEQAFGMLGYPRRIDQESSVITHKPPEEFSLKETVIAVTSFLKNLVSRFVKIEVSNLCRDDVSLSGNKSQLEKVIATAVLVVEKSFKNSAGVISVIIHDLKRVADAILLPKGERYHDSSALEKRVIENEVRGKYVAVSVNKKKNTYGGVESRTSGEDDDSEGAIEISYCDEGLIIKKSPSNIIIYLSRCAL